MSNQRTRIIDVIKTDPHGQVARNAAHWLAVEVMGWGVEAYQTLEDQTIIRDCYIDPATEEGVGIDVEDWRPFTDANHTRMLVQKVGEYKKGVEYDLYNDTFPDGQPIDIWMIGDHQSNPYADDTTHDACQVLRKCHTEGTLTNDELERWWV